MEFLPKPEVIRCFCDSSVAPCLSAMELRWHPDTPGAIERVWHLPQGISVHSSAPTDFGIAIERLADNAYKVQVLWNRSYFAWNPLTRVQILTSSLSLILKALGTDLWQLTQQPVEHALAA